MKTTHIADGPLATQADALVLGLPADGELPAATALFDRENGGLVARLREAREATGKIGETLALWGPSGAAAPLVVLAGVGDAASHSRQAAHRAAGAAAKWLAARPRKRIAFALGDAWSDDLVEAGVCGAHVGCVGQDLYRAEKNRHPFDELLWSGGTAGAVQRGAALGDAVNLTRRLVNEPPEEIYPESFADRATEVACERSLDIDVWDHARLEQERCGALLAVARGSDRPPRLVVMRHPGGGAKAPWLALVGKGVTFDSGGLSLKPTDSMLTMKCDMAGAATVLGAMQAIAQLGLPVNVLAVMGLVENMPSGSAMKLGDVLTARNGRTIEVANTDAEGRLVLADALSVAVDSGADRIIDLATLTGACLVALGTDVAGAMTNNQAWCDVVIRAAGVCGEAAWQLPMFADYAEQIKSEVADIRNTGEGRYGGAITAAKFLEQFVDGRPWTHLDIAGPAFASKPKPWIDGGASGAMVRTLVETVRSLSAS